MQSQLHRKILEMIATKQISAEEGYRLLKQEQQSGSLRGQEDLAKQGQAESQSVAGVVSPSVPAKKHAQWQEIAIIGMSGMFPDARNVDEYWENLTQGKNSIREIPESRWKLEPFYDPNPEVPERSYGKWGGFLPSVDEFDPLFFNITPKEAEYMDPRHRLFLQEAYKAIEDAGYAGQELEGQPCGVFVGVQEGEYFAHYTGDLNSQVLTGNSNALLSARLSYYMNLKGPSMAVDTACSASLVAISLACESLLSGQSKMAIAGGVSLIVSQKLYIALSKLGMLSPDGLCKTFDNAADGLVPSECVGAVLLKPLADALRDGDHVYGVISGYGMNQDGKTNGITAPSAPSQTSLIRGVYERFGIDPEAVSYIETHGTGTKLGDPIEVNALTDAFRPYTEKKNYCALGSVKTNIGHSLPASGMASLIKVLQSIRHKKIAPNLHLNRVNEHINLQESPFYVNTELQDWNPNGLRIAGISSFGMSGTNAHLVVREPSAEELQASAAKAQEPCLITLSAKTEDALQRKLEDLSVWLNQAGDAQPLGDVAYTLQIGRNHFPKRAAFVVRDVAELKRNLQAVLNQGSAPGYVAGPPKGSRSKPDAALKQFGQQLLRDLQAGGLEEAVRLEKLASLADLYVKGYDLNWKLLYANGKYNRLSLPVYPFQQERYWLPKDKITFLQDKTEDNVPVAEKRLHPLLDRNTSTLREQRFTTEFHVGRYPLHDHKIYGRHALSGGSMIEMMRAAGALAGEADVHSIKRLTVSSPLTIEESAEVQISLTPRGTGAGLELSATDENGTRVVYAQAEMEYENKAPHAWLQLAEVKARCAGKIASSEFKQALQADGLQVGHIDNAVQSIWFGDGEALIQLHSGSISSAEDAAQMELHPQFLDGALYGVQAWLRKGQAYFLHTVSSVDLYSRTPENGYAYVKITEQQEHLCTVDLLLTDEAGQPVASFTHLQFAGIEPLEEVDEVATDGTRRVLLAKTWSEQAAVSDPTRTATGTVAILVNGETQKMGQRLLAGVPGVRAVVLPCDLMNQPYAFDSNNAEQARLVAQAVLKEHGPLSCVLDLSDMHQEPVGSIRPSFGKMALLQEWIRALLKEDLELIHVTRGLQTFANDNPTMAGAETAALFKMLGAEYRKARSRTLDVDFAVDALNSVEALREIVLREWTAEGADSEVCYRAGRRYVPLLTEQKRKKATIPSALSPESVYVITGGTRGIGAEVAKHLVQKGARKLVLMGMQPYPPRGEWNRLLKDPQTDAALVKRLQQVVDLEAQGVQVELYSGALTDKGRLTAYFADIRKRLGAIGGVMHCAGLAIHNNPAFVFKSEADMAKVFEPKIEGLQVLHELFAPDRPKFFLLFASVSGLVPTLASSAADYSIANAFMDTFAAYQRSQGFDYYQTIQWPSWKEVGMGEVKSPMYLQLGLAAHTTAEGLHFLDQIQLEYPDEVSMMPAVVVDDVFRADVLLFGRQDAKQAIQTYQQQAPAQVVLPSVPQAPAPAVTVEAESKLLQDLKQLFSDELKIPVERLDDETPFGEWGIDSILLAELVKKVEVLVGQKLDPSMFLEYPTLLTLSGYLEEHLGSSKGVSTSQEETTSNQTSTPERVESPSAASLQALQFAISVPPLSPLTMQRTAPVATASAASASQGLTKIAVIGMACHFPGASDKERYWSNLQSGVNSIREIPKSRWDADQLYSSVFEKGKSISKWGGFIDDIELFDAEYFHFSEEDAPYIDPLMRQFLEISVDTLHDAGYSKQELSGRKVSVFVGSRAGLYAPHLDSVNRNGILGIGQNFVAAHVSHFFNFKGPNMVVDTACSSALVSIHLACQSLFSGESEMALAGGVDILLDEKPYLLLSEGKALSPDGQCHTFDEKANGFVPGEGCGAVLLKPLEQAIADGDRIYAVIDSTAINNDGYTMGATTPNPEMQSAVIRDALTKGGINPSSISFVETHGTGTMIGDPIELRALTRIYREFTEEKQFCAVGSVKTNFGHLLSAAGIASFIKVALSIWHKQLPPTLNCDKPNPRFEFANSPFYPVTSLTDWEAREGIRRAGISSFGFGGTNAHVIVSEGDSALLRGYKPQREPLPPVTWNRKRFWFDQVNEPKQTIQVPWQHEAAVTAERTPSFLQIADDIDEKTSGDSFLQIFDESETE